MIVYHTGYGEIPCPDVHFGRVNADFGQGFYVTAQREFALRWAQERKGASVIVNRYSLDLTGLTVCRLKRDAEWLDSILRHRAARPDIAPVPDVIIGPIANDTLFDTMGIISSGLLSADETLRLLQIGPIYEQIVLRTDRAAAQLRFLSARVLTSDELRQNRERHRQEQEAYQEAFAQTMASMEDGAPGE